MSAPRRAVARLEDAAVWHDVECGDYDVDLPLWRELVDERGSPVLDLGCGTGRVALDLAARGHPVTGVDSDHDLVGALNARAGELPVRGHPLDVRSLDLPGERFPLALAPMQVVQLLGGPEGRAAMLEHVRLHLQPGGLLAVALADPWEGIPADLEPAEVDPPMPDMREQDGWVLSSAPMGVREEDGIVAIDRLRHAVAPDGELAEALVTIALERLEAQELEAQATERGYRVLPARRVPETEGYVGSTVVMLEALT